MPYFQIRAEFDLPDRDAVVKPFIVKASSRNEAFRVASGILERTLDLVGIQVEEMFGIHDDAVNE